MGPGSKFYFQKYIQTSLEDDFKTVVGVSHVLWASFVIFLLLNINDNLGGWNRASSYYEKNGYGNHPKTLQTAKENFELALEVDNSNKQARGAALLVEAAVCVIQMHNMN
ncbi:uncharacterized protein LOC124941373 [Impatiens glandulifera]|uniref:uncharacterized protein LOC124917071 n=1 Tax=Impatiens glandulifera TaxID=253017 RepID=UPI001FB0F35E|nr:uncharacterized protein LOC124917071 [Impatiens glandulifera]XP_047337643.1 uncharacterized protein LOC124941373 [Impatiens glandulifera]